MCSKGNNPPIRIMFLHAGAELYGADQVLLSLVTGLDKNIFEPIVVLPANGPLVEKLQLAQIRVEIIPYPILRRQYFTLKGILNFIKEYKKSIKRLTKFAQREKIDVIHNNTIAVIEGAAIRKRLKKPLLVHIHEMIEEPKAVAKMLYSIATHSADKIVLVSQAALDHMMRFSRPSHGQAIVLHNGIDMPSKNGPGKTVSRSLKRIAIVGRINAIKGQDHFIKAISQLKGVHGDIIGDAFHGQEWRIDEMEKLILELGQKDNITYHGRKNNVLYFLKKSDLLVLPSTQNDSFPTVVLEAMSVGTPVVAYRCGGVEEMVTNGYNGYLVEQGNIGELAATIDCVLSDEQHYKRMSRNAIETVRQKFNRRKFIDGFSRIYEDLA